MRIFRTILILLAAFLFLGCSMTLGRQKMTIRPGFRVPQRSVDKGDGEQIIWERLNPEGNTMFVFIRGEL